MEIHNHGHNPKIHIKLDSAKTEAGKVDRESEVERTNDIKPQQLAERLEGDARVRERLLVEVKAKVAAGEYMTRAAAEEAAKQIVD